MREKDKARLKREITEEIIRRNDLQNFEDDKRLKKLIASHVAACNREPSLSAKRKLCREIYNSMRGMDILQPLMEDPEISEIMVNGPRNIFIERAGKIEKVDLSFADREELMRFVTRYFGRSNKLINEQKPIAGMRLPDGSRIHAVLPPAAPEGPCISIRRFTGIKPSLQSLVEIGTMPREQARFLERAVKERKSIFCSGGTGTGKTTFLNALSACIPKDERIITIEDALELDLQGINNLVRLEARQPGPDGTGEVSLGDLIKSSLRLRPDRIIVGEIRGAEAFDMVQAMSTGHPGSMSTGHGNSPAEMLDRICIMILMSSALPWEAIRRLLVAAIDLIVHLERLPDGRRIVREIQELKAYKNGEFQMTRIYSAEETPNKNPRAEICAQVAARAKDPKEKGNFYCRRKFS